MACGCSVSQRYDTETETYEFTYSVGNYQKSHANVFEKIIDGDLITCNISFLHFKGTGGYDDICYDDNKNPVLEHDVTNCRPELYAVAGIKDILPKWEFVFLKYRDEYDEVR